VDLTLATRDVDGKTIVAVGGEIDVYTAPKLRDKITELVAAGSYDILVDMEEVEFLDSTGLGVLVGGLKKVRAQDGSMSLICAQAVVVASAPVNSSAPSLRILAAPVVWTNTVPYRAGRPRRRLGKQSANSEPA